MSLSLPLIISSLLFGIGVFGVLARRNAVLVLVSVELMLNAANINLVAFDAWWSDALHGGQVLTLFVITIAAAEIGIGLAIVLLVFRASGSSDLDDLGALDERSHTSHDHVQSTPDFAGRLNMIMGDEGRGDT
ncbi:MAG TPA: NADH-quinone oxidoreductase subunit NuoK [Jiangellaceae bacterium]